MLLMLSNVLLLHLQYHKFCWISCLLSSKFFCLFLLTVKKFCCKSIHKVLYNLFISILGQNVLCRKMWTSFDYFTQQKVYKKVPKKKKKILTLLIFIWFTFKIQKKKRKKKFKYIICQTYKWYIQNPIKHMKWSILRKCLLLTVNYFCKMLHLRRLIGFGYTSKCGNLSIFSNCPWIVA